MKIIIIRQHVSSFSNEQVHSKPSISQAVSAKLEDGNVRAALRILMSDDSPAAPSPQSFQAMQEKHPPALSLCPTYLDLMFSRVSQ